MAAKVKKFMGRKKPKIFKSKNGEKTKNKGVESILFPIISIMLLITVAIYVQNIYTQWNIIVGSYDHNVDMAISMSKNMAGNMNLVTTMFEDEAIEDAGSVLENVNNFYEDNGEMITSKDLSEFMTPLQDRWLDILILDKNAELLNEKKDTADDSYKFDDIQGARAFADELIKTNSLSSNWITISTQTDVIIKYIYIETSDNKYIIEIAANIAKYNSNIDIYDFETYANDLVRNFDVVESAAVFNSAGYNTSQDTGGEILYISEKKKEIFDLVIENDEETEIDVNGNWGYAEKTWAIPIRVSLGEKKDVYDNYVLIISFDNFETMNYFYAQAVVNIFVAFLAMGVLLIMMSRNKSQYLNPLSGLTKAIEISATGDYDHPAKVSGSKMMKATIIKFNLLVLKVKDAIKMRDEAYFQTLNALVSAIDASDEYTGGHCNRVMEYSMKLGEKYKLSKADLKTLQYGSLLHDVGKIGIDTQIVNKTGRLNDEEFAQIKMHPQIGLNILEKIDYLKSAHRVMVEHHERWDGKGYPKGLVEEQADILSRIVSIADTYDAMSSDRSYRKALPNKVIIAELEKYAGIQFDPELVPLFVEILKSESDE
jgi:putative nucleotidyltransferase with HDIG domain